MQSISAYRGGPSSARAILMSNACSFASLLPTKEMAAQIRVEPDTLLGWARKGRIPCVRLGRKMVRFDPEAVIQALKASQAVDSEAR
jgi:excisionase family DNA binding protein